MNARRVSLGLLGLVLLAGALAYGARVWSTRVPAAGPQVDDIDRAVYAGIIRWLSSNAQAKAVLLTRDTAPMTGSAKKSADFLRKLTAPQGWDPFPENPGRDATTPERQTIRLPADMVRRLIERNRKSAVISAVPTKLPIAYDPEKEMYKRSAVTDAFHKLHPKGVAYLRPSLPAYNRDRSSAVVMVDMGVGTDWGGLLWLDKTPAGWQIKRGLTFYFFH